MNKTIKIVKNLIKPGETLSQKVVKGGFWVFFLRIFNRGFSLIRLIILARILSPNDFGLMGGCHAYYVYIRDILSNMFSTSVNPEKRKYKILS